MNIPQKDIELMKAMAKSVQKRHKIHSDEYKIAAMLEIFLKDFQQIEHENIKLRLHLYRKNK